LRPARRWGGREASGGFAVDTSWPKPLPNNWILGQVPASPSTRATTCGFIHRPKTLIDEEKGAALDPKRAKCCVPAPAVIEFDADAACSTPGAAGQGYEWFENEHGITVDPQGNVWSAATIQGPPALKFTPRAVPDADRQAGPDRRQQLTTLLGRPAHMEIDAGANELYVADGYGNKR